MDACVCCLTSDMLESQFVVPQVCVEQILPETEISINKTEAKIPDGYTSSFENPKQIVIQS